jgi:hypothetical protein
MKKKERSPDKPQASPNPRPKRRNKKQRDSMVKSKKRDNSPYGTPIQTQTHTPERPTVGNSFEVLQNESEGEDGKSVDTITADDPQIELESEHSGETESTTATNTHPEPSVSVKTPDDVKQRPTSSGPIAQMIPSTDEERLGTSIPLFASKLANTVGTLFPDYSTHDEKQQNPGPKPVNLKRPPIASLPTTDSPIAVSEQELAEEIFGEDAKPPAKNPYN